MTEMSRAVKGGWRWVLTAAFALLLIVTPTPPSAQATAPGNNGVWLVRTGDGLAVVSPTGGAKIRITTGYTWDARMSPDGAAVAYLESSSLRIARADGTNTKVASFPSGGQASELTWSPDGKQLAYKLTAGSSITIYTLTVASGQATKLLAFDRSGLGARVHVDWHPTRDLMAFTFGQDVWTVTPSTGHVAQWTHRCDYPDGLATTRGSASCIDSGVDQEVENYNLVFPRIRWEPKNDRLIVPVYHCNVERTTCSTSVGRLQLGDARAARLTAWPPVLADSSEFTSTAVVPAPDGRSYAHSDGLKIVRIDQAGTTTSTDVYGPLFDWQACGSAGCPTFRPVGKPTSITLVNQLSGSCTTTACTTDRIDASGKVTPTLEKPPVSVRLEIFKNGKWSVAATKSGKLSKKAAYAVTFQIPAGAAKCRVTATFPGDGTYSASSMTKAYLC